jgi:hypothetical protein
MGKGKASRRRKALDHDQWVKKQKESEMGEKMDHSEGEEEEEEGVMKMEVERQVVKGAFRVGKGPDLKRKTKMRKEKKKVQLSAYQEKLGARIENKRKKFKG